MCVHECVCGGSEGDGCGRTESSEAGTQGGVKAERQKRAFDSSLSHCNLHAHTSLFHNTQCSKREKSMTDRFDPGKKKNKNCFEFG